VPVLIRRQRLQDRQFFPYYLVAHIVR